MQSRTFVWGIRIQAAMGGSNNRTFYDSGGWWPARTHSWTSTMKEYDGNHDTPFPFEYGHPPGYKVDIQLRRGERLTRNCFNNGLHVNGVLKDGDTSGCLTAKVGEGSMVFLRGLGDLADGRDGWVCGGLGIQTIPSGGFGLPMQTAAGEKTKKPLGAIILQQKNQCVR